MKKIALWNNYVSLNQNKMFNPASYMIGEDLGAPIIHLKTELEKIGYVVETLDMGSPDDYERILFLDYPTPGTCCYDVNLIPKEKKYLLLTECEIINKNNANPDLYGDFAKVFTYDDLFVSQYGYIKLNIPNKLKDPLRIPFQQKKFCTLIAGNKSSSEYGELYSQRLNAIRFFENKYPEKFEFYGFGWNDFWFTGPKLIRAFNRIPWFRKLFAEKHQCYKGTVKSKLETLSQYKFCICYENVGTVPGYISEKIWDCFFAGCLPVYLGAPNILEYVPANCFIDRRNFESDAAVYEYLQNMTEEGYNGYMERICEYLKTATAYAFSEKGYADTIIRELQN